MWMLPLYLHVNKKSIDDDDDDYVDIHSPRKGDFFQSRSTNIFPKKIYVVVLIESALLRRF